MRSPSRSPWVAWLGFAAAGITLRAAPSVPAPPDPPGKHGLPYVIAQGETHKGDVYRFAQFARIAGTLDGDLTVGAETVTIPGAVTGDLYIAAKTVDISGKIGDSARIAASDVTISGTVDGDLLLFGGVVNVTKEAHVTGDLQCYCGRITMDGTVDGSLNATGGQASVGGRIGGDFSIKTDELAFTPGAHVGGDLHYVTREKLDLDGKGIVAGDIDYKEKKKEGDKAERWFSGWTVGKWFFFLVAAIMVGLVLLRFFPAPAAAMTASVREDMLRSSGVGFLAFIVIPVAAFLVSLLIITIPLTAIAIILYCVAVYVAKLPVAVWAGQRILGLLGRAEPSRYASLVVGLLALYVLFAIPCLGIALWFYCMFLGFGAILLGIQAHRQARSASAPPIPPAAEAVIVSP
jgi:cytoskeletal protein CcmA (bactofilin family)